MANILQSILLPQTESSCKHILLLDCILRSFLQVFRVKQHNFLYRWSLRPREWQCFCFSRFSFVPPSLLFLSTAVFKLSQHKQVVKCFTQGITIYTRRESIQHPTHQSSYTTLKTRLFLRNAFPNSRAGDSLKSH